MCAVPIHNMLGVHISMIIMKKPKQRMLVLSLFGNPFTEMALIMQCDLWAPYE